MCRHLALVCATLLLAAPALAQDFVGARALGMSEAYRAVATGNDAIYLNPAGIALIPRYSPELHYRFNLEAEDHQLDASIVDGKTTPIAVGIGYTFQGRELTRRTTLQHTGTFALSFPFIPQLLTIGAGLKYVNISDAFVGNYLNALSADVGGISRLPGGITVAAVGYNLIPVRSTDVPLSAAFAVAWDLGPLSAWLFGGYPALNPIPDPSGTLVLPRLGEPIGPLANTTLTFDWHIDFLPLIGNRSRYAAGLETMFFETLPLRAGYSYNERSVDDPHSFSVGAGVIFPQMGIDAAWQQNITDPQQRVFAVSLKLFFDL
jgi:hypothetical protein